MAQDAGGALGISLHLPRVWDVQVPREKNKDCYGLERKFSSSSCFLGITGRSPAVLWQQGIWDLPPSRGTASPATAAPLLFLLAAALGQGWGIPGSEQPQGINVALIIR